MSSSRTSSGTSGKTIAIAVGIVLVAAALLFAAFGLGDDTDSDAPTLDEVAGSPTVEGDALPQLPDGADPAVGAPAPRVEGADFDGEPVEIDPEQPTIVVFMASWCPACDADLPELTELLESGELPDDVEVISVSTSHAPDRPNWPPQDWFADAGYPGDIVVDDADGTIATAYGMSATPFWAFLQDGQVVGRAAGQLPMDAVTGVAADLSGS